MPDSKATWWSVTAYQDDIDRMEGPLPEWIKEIHGGREACPTTERLHFQGAVRCHQQQRFSKLKAWLPKSHIEAANSAFAIRKYCLKETTAVGEKTSRTSPLTYATASEICQEIGRACLRRQICPYSITKEQFWSAVSDLLADCQERASQFMNPSLRNFFMNTARVWIVEPKSAEIPGNSIVLPGIQTDNKIEHVTDDEEAQSEIGYCEQYLDCQICECGEDCHKR